MWVIMAISLAIVVCVSCNFTHFGGSLLTVIDIVVQFLCLLPVLEFFHGGKRLLNNLQLNLVICLQVYEA